MATKHASPKRTRRRYDKTPAVVRLVLLPLLAVLLTLLVESFARGSVVRALEYAFSRPGYFFYNALLILTTLSISELFRHRKSVLFLMNMVWVGLGIAARLVARERTQPFTSMDILVVKDAITLTTIYYTWPQIIMMYGSIFLGVVAIGWVVTRLAKRRRVRYWGSGSVVAGLVIACVCLASLGFREGWFPAYYDNLVSAYSQYGFATCFTFTFGNTGVKAPAVYSEETVTGIVDEVDAEDSTQAAPVSGSRHEFTEQDDLEHPNIIVVQLESLIDPNTIIGAEYSEDPTPNFNTLSHNFPSGELYVPSIGGGTVNVEFEVLTGMNLDFFGAGETPYSTMMQTTTLETIAYTLKELGYTTTAMHNHTATFYSRNLVYANMGFDHFVPLEYMPYATYNDLGWCEDSIFPGEISKALTASDGRDFIFAVTVESHGKYDEAYTPKDGDVEIYALPEQVHPGRMANYLHAIRVTDQMIGRLISHLDALAEPTIVIFYGDHLPSLDFTDDILTTGNLYASRYVIWNNYGARFTAPNLQAYRLSANLLKQLGVGGGVLSRFHQSWEIAREDDPDYLEKLQVLEYDLTSGVRSVYENGETPYKPVDMTLGTLPIMITSASHQYGRLLVNGQNFTEYSTLCVGAETFPTAFINSAQIAAVVPRTTPVDSVTVLQLALDGTELGRTEEFFLNP